MKGRILDALQAHAEGNIELHLANIEVHSGIEVVRWVRQGS